MLARPRFALQAFADTLTTGWYLSGFDQPLFLATHAYGLAREISLLTVLSHLILALAQRVQAIGLRKAALGLKSVAGDSSVSL